MLAALTEAELETMRDCAARWMRVCPNRSQRPKWLQARLVYERDGTMPKRGDFLRARQWSW